jgi:hypothetical protein
VKACHGSWSGGLTVRPPFRTSIIAQSSCLSFRATSARSGRRPDDATSPTQAASLAHSRHLGWQARGRWPQAERQPTSAAAQTACCARRSPALARDAARSVGCAFTAAPGHLAGCPGCHPSVKPRLIPYRSFLGAVRSPSLDRRGRLARRAHAGTVGTGGPDREGDQPAGWPKGSGLVRSLPRARSREPTGGSARDDVCAAEFLQAPPSAAGRRSTELGAVVRWVEGAAAGTEGPTPGRFAPNLARGPGMATCRRRDRVRRSSRTQLD